MKATVFHDIRGNRIFLCIATPSEMVEAAKLQYTVEREISPDNFTAEKIKLAVAEMITESGLHLELSEILKKELGI